MVSLPREHLTALNIIVGVAARWGARGVVLASRHLQRFYLLLASLPARSALSFPPQIVIGVVFSFYSFCYSIIVLIVLGYHINGMKRSICILDGSLAQKGNTAL